MLIRLFGENFRSLRDPFELSFVAADLPSEEDRGVSLLHPTDVEEPLKVLRSLGVYGPNASGKSTVLLAAGALWWLIRESSRRLEPGDSISPYEPFAFDSHEKAPIRLGCTLFHDGRLYEYEIRYTRRRIESEKLIRLDEPDSPLIHRQSPKGPVAGSIIDESRHIQVLASQPKENMPMFSFLAQHGPEDNASLLPIWKAFGSKLHHEDYSSSGHLYGLYDHVAKRLHGDSSFKRWILNHLIKPADLGIRDVTVDEIDIPEFLSSAPEDLQRSLADNAPYYRATFLHYGSKRPVVPMKHESAGTRKLYDLTTDWWSLAHRAITIFADELSASLHPVLLDHLVRAVNDRSQENDPFSQIAFSTHDTGLLESRGVKPPALRRDQVYFTSKDESGATALYSLAEFKDDARPVQNIRKRYLSDRYGAIPHVRELAW